MNPSKADYYRNLPSKRMGSGVLFFNERGEILIVQPTYKETWEIPGGIVELNESPRAAVLREVSEEIGLQIEPASLGLICVEYMSAREEITESLMFVFSGGVLTQAQCEQMKVDSSELKAVRFVPSSLAIGLLGPILGARIQKCHESTSCFYSEGYY